MSNCNHFHIAFRYNHILMFYIFLTLWTFLEVQSFQHIYCRQKAVPKDVLASFRDSIPNLQTGTVKVENPDFGSRYTTFNVTVGESIPKNYSLSVSVQNIYNFSPKGSLDFQVTAVKSTSGFVGQVVMDVDARWAWISICYVASGRNDFRVGNFIADNNQLISPTSNFTDVQIFHFLPEEEKVTGSYLYAVPFVSGMRTFDQQLSLSFPSSHYNVSNNMLKISVEVRYLNYPLQFLGVSFLIFSMASELQITSIYDIYFIPSSINTFLGVSSVNSSSGIFNRTSVQTVKPLLESTLTPTSNRIFEEMFGIDGVIVQTQQSIDVLYLPVQDVATTLSCVSKSTCSDYGGTMLHQQESVYDISSLCKLCPKNSNYNQTSAVCQCLPGFTTVNSTCIEAKLACLQNQVYNNNTQSCVCAALFVKINEKCVSIFSACPQNQIYFQGKCIQVVISQPATCREGYLKINGTCEKEKICLSSQILQKDTNICLCPNNTHLVDGACSDCSINETVISNGCVCKDGFFRIGLKCLKCSPNAYYDGKKCVCLKLYQGDGFTCTSSGGNLQTKLASEAPSGNYGGIILNKGV